jgi:hypothetical protein
MLGKKPLKVVAIALANRMARAVVKAVPAKPVLNRTASSKPNAWRWQEAQETAPLILSCLS